RRHIPYPLVREWVLRNVGMRNDAGSERGEGIARRWDGRRDSEGAHRSGARRHVHRDSRAHQRRRELWKRRGATAGTADPYFRERRGTAQATPAPRQAPRAEAARSLKRSHPIVLRVVLDLREAERLEERRHVGTEVIAELGL